MIIIASKCGHLGVVKYLSSLVSVDPGDRNNTAIILASKCGHLEVVEY